MTNKYEGHTPAEHWDFSTWGITMPTGFEADAQLIADAPLLLAEVIRLRDLLQQVADDYTDADGITYEIYCEFGGEEE